MTLLEAIVAFVILSVVGVACLDQSRGAAQLQVTSAEWTRAVARGESALTESIAGMPLHADEVSARTTRVRVERRRWRAGLDRIDVTVLLANGATYELSRLTPSRSGSN